MRTVSTVLALLTLLPSILAATLTGQIQYNEILPRNGVPIGSKISVNHGERKVWIKKDGSFEVTNLAEGEHILEPIVPGYLFQSYLITISPSTPPVPSPSSPAISEHPEIPSSPTESTYSIHIQPFYPAKLPLTTSLASLPNQPLLLQALSKEDYFTPKSGMNIGAMLKNPMVLMMIFTPVMLFALPKLTESLQDMDPEMAKEMAETRKKMNGLQNMDLAGSLSNMLAGSTEDTSAPAAINAGSGSNTPSRGGAGAGGKKRRGK